MRPYETPPPPPYAPRWQLDAYQRVRAAEQKSLQRLLIGATISLCAIAICIFGAMILLVLKVNGWL